MSTFDVVVIGGGPAGMMAAARAAQYGARTALIEKNKELGRKLMITGRGRCNFARAEDDPQALADGYRRGGDFLLPSLREFGTKETVAFFLRRGVVSERERGRRIYPREGQDAASVVSALWTALKDGEVQVLRGLEVRALDTLGGKVRRAVTRSEEIDGRSFILATGGLSFPSTGSTGDGYRWARKAGHSIVEPRPALCPVKTAERFDSRMAGLKLKNVRLTLTADGAKADERFGEMDFTPFGVSGAIVMDMASAIGEALKSSRSVTLGIDLKPALDPERLDARIDRDFEEFAGDALRFALRKMLPGEIIPEVIKAAALDLGKPCGETTPEERAALRRTLKNFTVTPTELLGFKHAIVTSGGIETSEIDPATMRSRILSNLYFAGEMIDVDGPTGGYNLQMCWTTGFTAGSAAAEALGFARPSDRQVVEQMERARVRRDERDKEERRKAEALSPAGEKNDAAREESAQDMTIQTSPANDAEFCGWKDPRKEKKQAEATESGFEAPSPLGESDLEERPSRPERDAVDRPPRRERDFGERPPRHERGFDEYRPRREQDFDNRPPRRERDLGDRPPRHGRGFDEYRPRRERDFSDRPPRRERDFEDRPPRHERGFDEYRPRRERDFGDRPPRRERDFGERPPRHERGFDEYRPRRDRDFGDRPPRRERDFEERPPRHERNFDEYRPRRERDFGDRPPRRERDFGDRPPRHERGFDEYRPRRERNFGDRPPRRERDFGERPLRHERGFDEYRPRRERDFGDRPPRRERDFKDRGFHRQESGFPRSSGASPESGRRFARFRKPGKDGNK